MYDNAPMMPTGRVHTSEVPAALLMFSPMKRKNGPIKMPPPTPNSEDTVPTTLQMAMQ